jgi:glycosyltransferase involved in cell wall biosynthesis
VYGDSVDTESAGEVEWYKNINELESIYSTAYILISSSYSEEFLNVIGEAMSCGVPCGD